MTDLLDTDAVADFKAAMRDVADTFQLYPVALVIPGISNLDLECGLKNITAELKELEGGEEIDEAFRLMFNREYLADMGLVPGGVFVGDYDGLILIGGKTYHITKIQETAIFRDSKLAVVIEVAR